MALACRPALLIADEPTTALDVTIQAQILELLQRLRRELGMAVLFITHDLGVVAETADRVAVLYAGQVVEYGDVGPLFARPGHPYTAGLLASLPRLGDRHERLRVIPCGVPDPAHFPDGCRFHPRCPLAVDRCRRESPELLARPDGRQVRCWRADEIERGDVKPAGPGAVR
jgi:oligopeptide/dipeptide ABC transporter ATP-binding protein